MSTVWLNKKTQWEWWEGNQISLNAFSNSKFWFICICLFSLPKIVIYTEDLIQVQRSWDPIIFHRNMGRQSNPSKISNLAQMISHLISSVKFVWLRKQTPCLHFLQRSQHSTELTHTLEEKNPNWLRPFKSKTTFAQMMEESVFLVNVVNTTAWVIAQFQS